MHQFIGQNFTKPCCDYTINSNKTPAEFWTSDELATLRKTLEQGVWPVGCNSCKNKELENQLSLRQRSLQEYDVPEIPKVEFVDVRLSNKCNFACRTCEPIFSSRIAKENKVHNLHEYYGYSLDKNYIEHSEQISQDIKSMLPNIKKLMFTGGEPTYIEQFYEIIDTCDRNIHLLVTTNASMIDERFLSYAKQFPNLHITLSIDAIGDTAEYIRYGTRWSEIDKNIKKILELKCSVMYNTVLSAYSVFGLEDLVNYIIANEQDAYGADMYICTNPDHLHPCVLPQSVRNNLTTTIQNCIIKLSNSKRSIDYKNAIQSLNDLLKQLDSVYLDNKKFIKFTKKLDSIRNQKYDNWHLWSDRIW